MDYSHLPYMAPAQFPTYMDGSAVAYADDGLIDPDLKTTTPPAQLVGTWDSSQIHRFLADRLKPSYLGYPQGENMFSNGVQLRQDGVTPLPHAMLQRQESPSYTQPSSTCSSTLSPPRDGEFYQVHSPQTPTDTATLSPYSGHYEFQFTGLADACVNPNDVHPSQQALPGCFEDVDSKTNLIRGLSMSSDDSTSNVNHWGHGEQYQNSQPLSPNVLPSQVKDEIHIPEARKMYPPIEPEDEPSSTDEVDHSSLGAGEEDGDYTPGRRHRRSTTTATRNARSRKRPHTSQPPTSSKRSKFDSSHVQRSKSTSKAVAQGSYPCHECQDIIFKDESGLQKHIKTQHTRPFICVFHFAGCSSTFASKNEWKRHCASQHILLNYWLCQQEQCAKVCNSTNGSTSHPSSTYRSPSSNSHAICAPALPNGAIFNRKDLYTQHLRRMHVPAHFKKQLSKQKKTITEWEDQVRQHQEEAHKLRCELPTHMECPAAGCNAQFDGPSAWDERMEHVAKHLDGAAPGSVPPISFGGNNDKTLVEWAARPDVSIIRRGDNGNWELHNPLKPNGSTKRETVVSDDDEDAEGEEVDE
jgi:hypothetical protein